MTPAPKTFLTRDNFIPISAYFSVAISDDDSFRSFHVAGKNGEPYYGTVGERPFDKPGYYAISIDRTEMFKPDLLSALWALREHHIETFEG